MKRTFMKTSIVALVSAAALSGCVTTGNFDATKSFIDTAEGYDALGEAPAVLISEKPSGSVSYSGGIVAEGAGFDVGYDSSKPSGAAAPGPVNYVVAKMDVDVNFDDGLADVTLSEIQRATAPFSVFDRSEATAAGLRADDDGLSIDPNDIVLGEAFDGTLTSEGAVLPNGGGGTTIDAEGAGGLTSGSGDDLRTYDARFGVTLTLRGTVGEEFLLGDAGLSLSEVISDDEGTLEIYSGAGYAVHED